MFQFRRFPSCTYGFSAWYRSMSFGEFPHSEIPGSKDVCSSPRLIAAYHVFHRLPVPRHSPCALCSLTVVYLSINISLFRFSICQRDFTAWWNHRFFTFLKESKQRTFNIPSREWEAILEFLWFFLCKERIEIRNFTSLKSHFAVLYSVFKVHLTPSASSVLLHLAVNQGHRPVSGTRPSTREVMLTKTRSEKGSFLFANLRVCGRA